MNIQDAYKEHIEARQNKTSQTLESLGRKGLVIGAGALNYYCQDDRTVPFKSYHHFSHWCPLTGADHAIIIEPGKTPTLLHHQPDDFWHEHLPLGTPHWVDSFEIKSFKNTQELWKAIESYKGYSYIGPEQPKASSAGLDTDTQELEHHLNWHRSFKSNYEVQCIDRATDIAARGHRAAYETFQAGGSELDIHLSYLKEARITDLDLPYNGIVAINEKAAVLHYEAKRDHPINGDVLLIDSGANYNGYASDITRTYTARKAPQEFVDLVKVMNDGQISLCQTIKPGLNFGELQHNSHLMIGQILLDSGLISGISKEEAYERGITRVFYPHGIGHMLGIFVHDVGGKQKNAKGDPLPADKKDGKLRTLRTIEPQFVFTVEPGLYFIDMLLNAHREGDTQKLFDWKLIDQLKPFGGIRIEDNLVVTNDGIKNITRQYLP